MCKLSLFGSPALECNGIIKHIPRRKAKALLAYLAVTQQSHSREALVALLWPEQDHRSGRADLSRIISALRKTLGDDYFLTDRESVSLNESADLGVDVVHFLREMEGCRKAEVAVLDDECRRQLATAASLYQADFLAGFTLPDCPAFDEWQLFQTEALRRDLSWALGLLVHTYEDRHNLAQGIAYAQRWIRLDPLHEPAQRRLIALYARNGQRSEAHHQYQAFERLLAEELGVEPQPETRMLYEQIRSGFFRTPLIEGRFQLLKKEDHLLGRGSFGEVYRGLDVKLDKPVAIKVIHPGVIRDNPDILERFTREGNALRQLEHPNIAKMIAAVIENDQFFLIMEHVSGSSLRDLIARHGPLPLPRVLEIGLGLADGLAHAHQLNIIHRDIKPANVLLADDGTPRLTDFGLAQLGDVSHLTQVGALPGAVGYLSPEACKGENLDIRSDIWSLGVLLAEMITGENPFAGNTTAATITAILNQPTPDLRKRYPDFPPSIANLVGRMLVKNRDERLPSMRVVGAELEAIQHGRSLNTADLPKKLEQEIRFFYSFDGARIAYAIVGGGPPLVLTATYLRHLEFEWQSPVWKHWLEALARHNTLIRYDERGCGLSDWNVSEISFNAWVRDLEALVDHLDLDRFPLLALSQGGPVAIAYAARHPEKVSHLMLHGAYARGRFLRVDSPQAAEEAQTLLSLMELGWGRDNPAFRQVFSTQLMPDATREQLVWFDELMRVSMSAENALRAETEMYNINVLDLLPELSVPTLVTHCRYDESIPFSEGRVIASQIPGARFVPLDSKNHLLLPTERAWEQFVHEIRRFIAPDSASDSVSLPAGPLATFQIPLFRLPEFRTERDDPFVGRTRELARLDRELDEALEGKGRIVFVTGGAGRGKSSLLEEFARQAQEARSDLLIASGHGDAIAGVGDPYLPFREVIGVLTGEVRTIRPTMLMGVEQARRIWTLLPQTVQIILENGPQLLDVFVPGKQLLARASEATPKDVSWLESLRTEVARRQDVPGAFERTAIFGQFTSVLHHLAQNRPLLIILDDLQWIDEASIGLLFHLGRRLAGSRILIVAAYRPDELLQVHKGELHPLVRVVDEFKRTYGDIFIDLADADLLAGRVFIEALLNTQPNRLDKNFREALFQRTGGHPLFTVELLRDMKSQGDLVQDESGYWSVGQELNWDTFPARVDAVIAGRVDRLDSASRDILKVASVEGELFSAEVVARVLGIDKGLLLDRLFEQLGKRHRLVRERGEQKVGGNYLSRYQFRHALFQQYLYHQISPGERRRLHGEVAENLATLYANDINQVVVQLAYHYTAADDSNNASVYWSKAGDLAYRSASLLDAIRHYQSALAHLPKPDDIGRAQTLRKLGECQWIIGQQPEAIETLQTSYTLSNSVGDKQGAGAAQRLLGRVYWELGEQHKARNSYRRALTVMEGERESKELAWALAGLSNYFMHIGDYGESIPLGKRALEMARSLGAEEIVIQCLCDLGSALSGTGDWEGVSMEQESLERALASNRPHDAGRAYIYISEALLYLGHYEQARDVLTEAVTYTQRMHVPYITEAASRMLAEIDWLTGNWSTTMNELQKLVDCAGSEKTGNLSQNYLGLLQGRIYNDLGQAEKAHHLLAELLAETANTLDPRVALLGEYVRAETALDRPAESAAGAAEILEWTDEAYHLYPNTSMALLTVCRSPVAFDRPEMLRHARLALQQLERLDRQYRTPATAACLLEGQGWVSLAEVDIAPAVVSFEQAADRWQDLGHPYDHLRALSGIVHALSQSGDKDGVKSASEGAIGVVESLAAQLEDPDLRISFLYSKLVQKFRANVAGN